MARERERERERTSAVASAAVATSSVLSLSLSLSLTPSQPLSLSLSLSLSLAAVGFTSPWQHRQISNRAQLRENLAEKKREKRDRFLSLCAPRLASGCRGRGRLLEKRRERVRERERTAAAAAITWDSRNRCTGREKESERVQQPATKTREEKTLARLCTHGLVDAACWLKGSAQKQQRSIVAVAFRKGKNKQMRVDESARAGEQASLLRPRPLPRHRYTLGFSREREGGRRSVLEGEKDNDVVLLLLHIFTYGPQASDDTDVSSLAAGAPTSLEILILMRELGETGRESISRKTTQGIRTLGGPNFPKT